MIRYVAQRLVWTAGVLVGLSFLFFALEQVTPGGPCAALRTFAPGAPKAVAACSSRFASGQGLPLEYVRVMQRYLQGDVGAYATTQSVGELLATRLPEDVLLFAGAVAIQVPLALALGSAIAIWPRAWLSRVGTALVLVGRSVPQFWLAVMLFWLTPGLFSLPLGPLSLGGTGPRISPMPPFWSHAWFAALARQPGRVLEQLLPIFLLTLIPVVGTGVLASVHAVRDVVDSNLRAAHAHVARAAGLSRGAVARRTVRASLAAIMARLAGQLPALLGTMAVVEYVLHWPGSLSIFFYAGANGDPAMTQGLLMVVSLVALTGAFFTSALQGILDPRVRVGALPAVPETPAIPTRSVVRSVWLAASTVVLVLAVFAAVFAPVVSPESFTTFNYTVGMVPPRFAWPWQHDWRYLLGSDGTSRSMLMWVTYGARIPLAVGLLATLVATAVAVLSASLSSLPGMVGAWGDLIRRWVAAVLSTPPALLLLFPLSAYMAHGRWPIMALLIGLVSWPSISSVITSRSIVGSGRSAVLSGRAIGVSGPVLMWREVRPLLGPLVYAMSRCAAAAIALDAALDFLQVGILPTASPTLGNAFALNPSYFGGRAWWVPFFPGLCIVLISLSLSGVGEGLRRLLALPSPDREHPYRLCPPRREGNLSALFIGLSAGKRFGG